MKQTLVRKKLLCEKDTSSLPSGPTHLMKSRECACASRSILLHAMSTGVLRLETEGWVKISKSSSAASAL